MIALDTNVLVRYLVEDEPREQCERAARLVESAVDQGRALFVSHVVAYETVWVLESAYGVEHRDIAEILSKLLETRHVHLQDRALVRRALRAYRDVAGDFADYLIREIAHDAGCDAIATFDADLLSEDGFIEPDRQI